MAGPLRGHQFRSWYGGFCGDCDQRFPPGTMVEYRKVSDDPDELSKLCHVECPEDVPEMTPGRNEKHCNDCGIIHAGKECP